MGALGALIALFLGCQASPNTDHEEEAHARPAHMPVSFVEAIPDLARRLKEVKKVVAEKQSPAKEALSEIHDIVRWLPLLAGESDLRKADWDSVNELSVRLEKLLGPEFSEASVDADCEPILVALQRLADKAKILSEPDWK